MSSSSVVTLASLRLQAQQRADMENSSFVSTVEWNQYLTNSYKELYDLLVAAYGSDYYVATPYVFVTDGVSQTFSLPVDFYKLLGVDIAYSTSQSSYVTVHPFKFAERNRYSAPNTQAFNGRMNLRYRIRGSQLWLMPLPAGGQTVQVFYIPEPSNLQFTVLGSVTNASTTFTTTMTDGLSVGMTIIDPSKTPSIPAGTTITAISTGVSITLSQAATASATNLLTQCYSDSTTIDGIAGWEEYVLVDSAIKARIKEESDVTILAQDKLDIRKRLEDMSNNRDAANPSCVSDVSDYYSSSTLGSEGGY